MGAREDGSGMAHRGEKLLRPRQDSPVTAIRYPKRRTGRGLYPVSYTHLDVYKRQAMSRQAIREGYPEIGAFYQQAAFEEAEHAAKFAELLGEVVTNSTKKNLELRVAAENGATAGKLELAKKAKALNLDAIHDTVHEMAKDEARHGCGFAGLLERYFGK